MLTFAEVSRIALGNRYAVTHDVTLDAYVKGGPAITPASVGLAVIESVVHVGGNALGAKQRYAWDRVNGKLVVGSGVEIETFVPGGGDIKGATAITGVMATADQVGAPVNATLVATADTFTNFAGTIAVTGQPDCTRNLVVTIVNDTGGNLNLYVGTCLFHVVGTYRGAAQVEDIAFVVLDANKAVAHAPDYRMVAGAKPFDTVTAITYDHASAGTLKVEVGVGCLFGPPKYLATPAEADVKKITVNAANKAVAGLVDTTNNTISSGTIADGDDVAFEYLASGEIPAGTDLSAYIPRLQFIGY